MTDEEFEFHAITLGAGGYARFLRLNRSSQGDYTAERHERQKGLTVDQIWQDMEAKGLTAKDPTQP